MHARNAILSKIAAASRRAARDDARPARQLTRAPIALRHPHEIAAIRAAGDVLREALDRASDACVAGATTADVNAAAMRVITAAGATPLFLGYPASPEPHGSDADDVAPFPACCCISVNDEVVHGIPGTRVIRSGDLVSIDCGVRLASPDAPGDAGWCADAAVTIAVGPIEMVRPEHLALIECAQDMLSLAVAMAGPGERWSVIAEGMQDLAMERGCGVLTEYVGHGIGRELHESPQVPNCLTNDLVSHGDFTLRPGMVLAIEPMVALGGAGVDASGFALNVATRRLADGWTVVTADGSFAAHAEHTIVVTRRGCEVLTLGRGCSLSTHTVGSA